MVIISMMHSSLSHSFQCEKGLINYVSVKFKKIFITCLFMKILETIQVLPFGNDCMQIIKADTCVCTAQMSPTLK